MKIYVLVKCVTIDKRDAIGNICDVQVFQTKEEAKEVIQKSIDWEISCSNLLEEDILKNEHDSPYYLEVNYDACDSNGSNDHYQWQVRESEVKEEIIKHQKLQATEQQQEHISFMLGDNSDLLCAYNDCIVIDGYISYDDMAKIADYLRKEE